MRVSGVSREVFQSDLLCVVRHCLWSILMVFKFSAGIWIGQKLRKTVALQRELIRRKCRLEWPCRAQKSAGKRFRAYSHTIAVLQFALRCLKEAVGTFIRSRHQRQQLGGRVDSDVDCRRGIEARVKAPTHLCDSAVTLPSTARQRCSACHL